jgi:hypothetical protein
VRVGLLSAGVALTGAGSGFYLAAALGAGPRDSLMVVCSQRTTLRTGRQASVRANGPHNTRRAELTNPLTNGRFE